MRCIFSFIEICSNAYCYSATEIDDIPELKTPKLDTAERDLETIIKKQSGEFFNHRDNCEKLLSRNEWISLLVVNSQRIPPNDPEVCVCLAVLDSLIIVIRVIL